MSELVQTSENQERVRHAIIKFKGSVTVGDVMSETGLTPDSVKASLNALMINHESILRVSERGELLYVFNSHLSLRDQRSWWDRHKQAILSVFFHVLKTIAKLLFTLTILAYFFSWNAVFGGYLILISRIIAKISFEDEGRNHNSIDFIDRVIIIWRFFFGRRHPAYEHNVPALHNRMYNYAFGPDDSKEPEPDPLEDQKNCVQLIRAQRGVITVEDWMMVSGHRRAQCESELAQYTALFEGRVEITKEGSLLYVFEKLVTSAQNDKEESYPKFAWDRLEALKEVRTNPVGDRSVIVFCKVILAIGIFNALLVIAIGCSVYNQEISIILFVITVLIAILFFAGVPIIMSPLVLLGPTIRKNRYRNENLRRVDSYIYKQALKVIYNTDLDASPVISRSQFMEKTVREDSLGIDENIWYSRDLMIDLIEDFEAEDDGDNIIFSRTKINRDEANKARNLLNLDKAIGDIVFSTDQKEQEHIEDKIHADEIKEFDHQLDQKTEGKLES